MRMYDLYWPIVPKNYSILVVSETSAFYVQYCTDITYFSVLPRSHAGCDKAEEP